MMINHIKIIIYTNLCNSNLNSFYYIKANINFRYLTNSV